MHKIFITTLLLLFSINLVQCDAKTITYTDNDDQYYENTYNDYPSTYCAPSQGVLTRIKNALFGVPTGYTPAPIMPSSYLNSYGPSYMRGFYGNNGWNSHNIYNPVITGSGIHILD
mgnify:CR=1 FL=1